jgi:GxxExxY protein
MVVEGKYKELTGHVIGCAMEVHKILGCGFQEKIYQRALYYEMCQQQIMSVREYDMDIFYKEEKVGNRRVDFLVEGLIAVEIKALSQLEPLHLAQAINYLEAYQLEVGLLLNFGSARLEFKRIVNPKFHQKYSK